MVVDASGWAVVETNDESRSLDHKQVSCKTYNNRFSFHGFVQALTGVEQSHGLLQADGNGEEWYVR